MAWLRAEGEDELRNALVRGQASVLLFMALKSSGVLSASKPQISQSGHPAAVLPVGGDRNVPAGTMPSAAL